MSVISVEHVSKSYTANQRTVTALDDVTLQVKEGDTIALVGPSGSGKTTLLRIVAGLETPDAGTVKHDGQLLRDVPTEQRGIGMIFQDYALIPQWNVERNIGFYLRLRRRQREVPQRMHDISQITGVDIDQLMGKFPRHLSGGEKQRVSIARAFARDLRLLLFDEPFANLDATFRTNARLEARRLLNKYPVTMLYVTHDQQEAAMITAKVAVMRAGKIEQIGSYTFLYNNPNNVFVAQFIGVPTMNLFEGEIVRGAWVHETLGAFIMRRDIPDGTAVTLGIRPHHIHVQPDDSGDIACTVRAVEANFAQRYHLLDVQAGSTTWQIEAPFDQQYTQGDTVACTFDRDALFFFDTATGARLL